MLNRRTKPFSFLFLSEGKNILKKISTKVCRYKLSTYICSVIKTKRQ